MKKTTKTLLWLINAICTVIFCGLCLQIAGIIFFSIYHSIRPENSGDMMLGMDLTQLFGLSHMNFAILFSLALSVPTLKAFSFFYTIKIFSTLNVVKPFSREIASLISTISYLILTVGILGTVAIQYSELLKTKGMEMDQLQRWWDDSYAYLFVGCILFVIAQIFKRGLELQAENDLTI